MWKDRIESETAYKVGQICQMFRKGEGYTQSDVARDLNRSVESVSAFENGRSKSYIFLFWYLEHGLSVEEMGMF